jgi:hypothetical protein
MKKILFLLLAALTVSCFSCSKSEKRCSSCMVTKEASKQKIVNYVNKKMPLVVQDYNKECDNIISIKIDSFEIIKCIDDKCEGLFHTTWVLKKDGYNDIFSSTEFEFFDDNEDNTVSKKYVIQVLNIKYDHKTNLFYWKTIWPPHNPFCHE